MPVAERLSVANLPDRPEAIVVKSFPTRWWRRHAYILPSFLICIVPWSWFVTWGDWKFFEPEDFCGFYDALARSILHGHLDVPRDAIGVEAFTFEGRAYGYFGIRPALAADATGINFQEHGWIVEPDDDDDRRHGNFALCVSHSLCFLHAQFSTICGGDAVNRSFSQRFSHLCAFIVDRLSVPEH